MPLSCGVINTCGLGLVVQCRTQVRMGFLGQFNVQSGGGGAPASIDIVHEDLMRELMTRYC